jgi:hypothetical protein
VVEARDELQDGWLCKVHGKYIGIRQKELFKIAVPGKGTSQLIAFYQISSP